MPIVAALIDRLLVASCEMPLDAGVSRIVEEFVAIGVDALPGAAIGVRLPSSFDTAGDKPARLFPTLKHERVIAIPAVEGATLHVAADDRSRVFPNAPVERFLARFVMTIGAALRHTRAHEELRARHARLHDFDAKVVHTNRLASFGQIAADIVHEINSPLTSVLAYSDYLHQKARHSGTDPADAERLARLHQAAERIHSFTRDLLAYARPTHSVPTPVAIHDVIDQALVFCDHVLSELDVTVDRAFGDIPAVHGFADQLTQIFVNLFTNAAHAMRQDGGRLTIQTLLLPDACTVRVKVEDEGHGIAVENLEKIFEPYFTTKPEGTATGLGLSIVRNIVTSHGGFIRAYARPNQGAVFEVDMPAEVRPNELGELPR